MAIRCLRELISVMIIQSKDPNQDENPEQTPEGPEGGAAQTIKPVRWLPLVFVALPLIVFNTGWIANSEMKSGVTEVTSASLFLGVTFLLFFITLLNLAVRRLLGTHIAMNQAELMLLYSVLSISSVVAGVGNMGFFLPFLANAFYYANPGNGWRGFWHLLPPYIGPRDPAILSGFFQGHSTFFQPAVMAAWAMPLAVWAAFFLVLLWTTLCMGAMVRRRWAEEEHLPFPVIALPLEMTKEGGPIYRNKLLWAGFAAPFILHSLNSLASIIPGIPSIPINSAKDLAGGLPFPLNSLSPMFGGIHGAGIGFGYLINTDVLFSLWFFYFVRKVFNFWGVAENWRDPGGGQLGDGAPQFPYTSYQAWGAWLALGVAVVWQGRSYFGGYFRRAFRGDPSGQDHGEPMSARMAVLGFLAGFLALSAFVWSSGGTFWLPLVFLGIYVVLLLALTRLEAETAVLSPYLGWIDPQSMMTTIGGTSNFGTMDKVHMGMLSWFNHDYRAASMPHQLQAFVGQKRAGGSMRGVPLVLMGAAAVSLVFALLWDLQLYYVNGAATGHVNSWRIAEGSAPFDSIQEWIQHPKAPDHAAMISMVSGAAITGGLALVRARFVSFPLSPTGYVINTSWANDLFWLDGLIAWGLKTLILRYGGIKFYRQMLPLFLGLILGDFVAGSLWSLIGTILHLDLFRTFPT